MIILWTHKNPFLYHLIISNCFPVQKISISQHPLTTWMSPISGSILNPDSCLSPTFFGMYENYLEIQLYWNPLVFKKEPGYVDRRGYHPLPASPPISQTFGQGSTVESPTGSTTLQCVQVPLGNFWQNQQTWTESSNPYHENTHSESPYIGVRSTIFMGNALKSLL